MVRTDNVLTRRTGDIRGTALAQAGQLDCRLDLLNGFQMTLNGRPIGLPATAQRLVAYLALQDRPLQRSYIAGVLWTDTSAARSMGSLRSSLWRLHEVGRMVVEATGQRLGLSSSVSVDVRRTIQSARMVERSSQPLQDGVLEELIDAGELLPDWYDDWVIFERERLRQLRLHALEVLSFRLAEAGRFALAIEAALAAVKAEPLRDSAHRALIAAHLMEGNRSEAQRHYRIYSDVMQRELQIGPSISIDEISREFSSRVTAP